MKRTLLVALALASAAVGAEGVKPCDELKVEITAKLEAKGVRDYSLEVVGNSEVGDKTVVGSCENSTRKIVYLRGK